MKTPASMEEAFHFLQEENRKFENHWLWKKLSCPPQEFFRAFERHLSTLPIPRDKWERALDQAKAATKLRKTHSSAMPQGLRV